MIVQKWNKLFGLAALILAVGLLAMLPANSAFAIRYEGLPGSNWDVDANWDGGAQPGFADNAQISRGKSVVLNTAETIDYLIVSYPDDDPLFPRNKVTTLTIEAGADLLTLSNSGVRVGRDLGAGQSVGDAAGHVFQTGGDVVIETGSNGLRLSEAANAPLADSLYVISGGSLRGGVTNGSLPSELRIGRDGSSATWGTAKFKVKGSGATEIRFKDVVLSSRDGVGGKAVLSFALDAGGVTPIVSEDELRLRNSNYNKFLEVTAIDAPPEADIDLVIADRLTDTDSPLSYTEFANYSDGDPLKVFWGLYSYNYKVRYLETGASGDGLLESKLYLEWDEKKLIPEPSSVCLAGLACAMLLGWYRRRK